ncbi:MAG: glutamate racemase [Elusimicrobia bacterium]|nr:glutamate racemase [Elusimicrobiota bacterium]
MKDLCGERPIGVFDSGVGGLTVFRALRRAMPREHLVYLGDTARVPYGTKSKEAVTRYSLEIGRFLERRGVKHVVVACNTATALALPALKRALNVPVTGVIQPAVHAARAAARSGAVAVIGTEGTVASGAYQKAWRRAGAKGRMVAAACPLFVPLVEAGWWDHKVTKAVAKAYLEPLLRAKPAALILGCTHYPLLKPVLAAVAGRRVVLIDSGTATASQVRALLAGRGVLRRGGKGSTEFFVTDGPGRFELLAKRFLGRAAKAKVVRFPG